VSERFFGPDFFAEWCPQAAEGGRGHPRRKKVVAGTGFVAAMAEADAEAVVEATEDGRIIGRVEEGEEGVAVRGLEL
jgi:phosphoribosylaminoimidazole (AIR) synthetase